MDEVEDLDRRTHFRESEDDDKICPLNISFFNIMYFLFFFLIFTL